MWTAGSSSATSSARRSSWRGSITDHKSEIAIASTSSSPSRRIDARAWDSSSCNNTLPCASMRSRTPMMRRRGKSIGGLCQCAASVRYSSSMPITLLPLAMGTVASKPAVVSSPTRAPVPVSKALIPVVVACAMSSASAMAAGPEMPRVDAARSIESRMPWLRSCFVDSALPTPTRPPGARITVSVKVPPVSTPMRYTRRKIRSRAGTHQYAEEGDDDRSQPRLSQSRTGSPSAWRSWSARRRRAPWRRCRHRRRAACRT